MIINISINLYSSIIILSIILGLLYIYKFTKKENKRFPHAILYFMLYISFAFYFGKLYTALTEHMNGNYLTMGLSAYGGLIGTIVSAIIFEKLQPINGTLTKYTILSLPLVYSVSKIACFLAGCCGGIPYSGFLHVIYPQRLNIPQFPIQLVETIVSLIVFLICHKLRNKKNITYITIILIAIVKASLDFLRYDHLTVKISANQIFSFILITITILIYGYQKIKTLKN